MSIDLSRYEPIHLWWVEGVRLRCTTIYGHAKKFAYFVPKFFFEWNKKWKFEVWAPGRLGAGCWVSVYLCKGQYNPTSSSLKHYFHQFNFYLSRIILIETPHIKQEWIQLLTSNFTQGKHHFHQQNTHLSIQLLVQLRWHHFHQYNIYVARILSINPASISVYNHVKRLFGTGLGP